MAEVSIERGGSVRVHRVVCAVDCGIAVNPDIIRAQMEGGIAFGLGAALYGEITLSPRPGCRRAWASRGAAHCTGGGERGVLTDRTPLRSP